MRFKRKPVVDTTATEPEVVVPPEPGSGPHDIADVDVDRDGVTRVDLGSLLIVPGPGRDVRLQVDEASQTVQAVVIADADGAIEVKAFAAPRNEGIWDEVRPQIAADMARRGGTATEKDGSFGTELHCQMTVKRPDGSTAVQPSRIVAVEGPRWLLRATLLGRPAIDVEAAGPWESVLRDVVVRRGESAMPVGTSLPLKVPATARRIDPAVGAGNDAAPSAGAN
ncbi:DUF3710 domain-containing protein [Nocardioides limicola]|uniref:DUF3710 domain-containing protein n=1 Tax=Nocardioides limicola TaxID=2803368 RepID=UPI00193B9C1A|nr:DUF3710 domain-containing protein [Nocardioides sp. DJM-14]